MRHEEQVMVLTLLPNGRFQLTDHSASREDAYAMLRAAWEALDERYASGVSYGQTRQPDFSAEADRIMERRSSTAKQPVPDFVKAGNFRHKNIPCNDPLCLPSRNADHFEENPSAMPTLAPTAPAEPVPLPPVADTRIITVKADEPMRHRKSPECQPGICTYELNPDHFEAKRIVEGSIQSAGPGKTVYVVTLDPELPKILANISDDDRKKALVGSKVVVEDIGTVHAGWTITSLV